MNAQATLLRHVGIRAIYIAVVTAGLYLLTPPGAALFLWAAVLLALGEGVLRFAHPDAAQGVKGPA